jgi:hypothetical protein
LAELTQSSNEATIRLQALREILDRLLGKPPVAIDSTVIKADVGAMYLAALKRANSWPWYQARPCSIPRTDIAAYGRPLIL